MVEKEKVNCKNLLFYMRKVTTIIVFIVLDISVGDEEKEKGMVYILIWTNANQYPFTKFKLGSTYFNNNGCKFTNCYLTNNTAYFDDVTKFDAILFNSIEVHDDRELPLPAFRATYQTYIFVGAESPVNYPVNNKYNHFFNWTWTYKLNSDNLFTYIAIKDMEGNVIGPKLDMHWIDVRDMKTPRSDIKSIIKNKTEAVAWFVSHCKTSSNRENYVTTFRNELNARGLAIDIFGRCENFCNRLCPVENMNDCYSLLTQKYFFYLAFENSMSEDYVTEKVLTATKNLAVPVVYGGANYTRRILPVMDRLRYLRFKGVNDSETATKFMPDGMYLDALDQTPAQLAQKIHDILGDEETYYDMFKWHNHYRFIDPFDSPDTNSVCTLCRLLNDKNKKTQMKVYDNIVKWFNERVDWHI